MKHRTENPESTDTIPPMDTEERRLLEEVAAAVAEESRPGQLREVLGIDEGVLEAMEGYAHDLYRHGRFERAGTIIEGILALDHTRYYPYLLVGDIALQQGEWSDGARCFEAAINFCDDPTPMLFGKLGEAYVRDGEFQKSITCLTRAIELGETDDKYTKRSRALLETIIESVGEVASEN